ncbi:MAG: hypothetical protein IJ386_04740, partial [Clostridia bacterium]|nr:hypothetical protein [Clostridia bacterium]
EAPETDPVDEPAQSGDAAETKAPDESKETTTKKPTANTTVNVNDGLPTGAIIGIVAAVLVVVAVVVVIIVKKKK